MPPHFFLFFRRYFRIYLSALTLWSVWFQFDLIPPHTREWNPEKGWWLVPWMRYQIFAPLFILLCLNLFWYWLMWKIMIRWVLEFGKKESTILEISFVTERIVDVLISSFFVCYSFLLALFFIQSCSRCSSWWKGRGRIRRRRRGSKEKETVKFYHGGSWRLENGRDLRRAIKPAECTYYFWQNRSLTSIS